MKFSGHHGPDGWPTFINLRPAVAGIKASLDVGAGESRTAFATEPGRVSDAVHGELLFLRSTAIATRPEARWSAPPSRWTRSGVPVAAGSVARKKGGAGRKKKK